MTQQSGKSVDKPLVMITGAAGGIGTALSHALRNDYRIIALDQFLTDEADYSYKFDLTSADSVNLALRKVREDCGDRLAAVIHLAAYFDFSGKPSPLYDKVNVQGTENLLTALESFTVERFIYSSSMLVHRPGVPGQKITEQTPLQPGWVYPQSKADTEAVIRDKAGDMPYTLLRLAGLYSGTTCVPTLAHQIARIYEGKLKSHLYSGNTGVGQAFVHQEDMLDAFHRTIDRRHELPQKNAILIGEPRSETYEALQNRLGELIHGEEKWATLSVPKPIAKTGAWVEEHAEPLVPDDFDKGEKPFIRPFMIDLAEDHYELDITQAKEQLGWQPQHTIYEGVAKLVENLKKNPNKWYQDNGITPPDWLREADELGENPDRLLAQHNQRFIQQHQQNLWAHFATVGLGGWLLTSPLLLGYSGSAMAYSDGVAGVLLMIFGALALSWRYAWARWVSAGVGLWVLFAPLAFWADSATAYLNSTLVGLLAIAFAAAVRPVPGVSPVAANTGPTVPPGWDNNPSSWLQRLPVIALALLGFLASRYMAAYQLGYIDNVWDPFFAGVGDTAKNGTEAIITSDVSESFPVADAGMGAIVYALEILLGLIGTTQRWRTMPWLVASFGVLIVPLGVVSITFIIIQPILIGTWCTLCLITAAAMLLQIAYAFNEFVATGEFLYRRYRAGAPVLKLFFVGDTDVSHDEPESVLAKESLQRQPLAILRDSLTTGVNLPWNLVLCVLIGLSLMSTRITLGNEGDMANWDHLIGALIITVAVIALAESARPLRWLLTPLGATLLVTPFVYGVAVPAMAISLLSGVAVMALSLRRGPIHGRYGCWQSVLR